MPMVPLLRLVVMLVMSPSTLPMRPSRLVIEAALLAMSELFWVTRPSRPVIAAVLPAMSAVFCATSWLVLNSWPPFTASWLSAATVPSATLISLRAPAVPRKSTAAPSLSLPTVRFSPAADCWTMPMVPLLRLVVMLVMSPSTLFMRPSRLVILPSAVVMRPPRLAIEVALLEISAVFCVTRVSSPAIDTALAALSVAFWVTRPSSLPRAPSTLSKPAPTLVAAPLVPPMVLVLASR